MKRTILWFLALALSASSLFAQDNISKGKVALSSRDTTAAIQAFKDALKANQKAGDANYYLGAIAYARHNLDEAQTYLEAATRINDENADALALLADVYVAKKNTAAALATYKKAQKIAPKSQSVATGYGLALLAADSTDAAIIQLTRAKDQDGNNPAVYVALGEAYLKQRVVPLAVMNYRQAIALAPKQMEYRLKLAQIYEQNRQWTDAVAEYDSIANMDQSNADAYLQMGQILIRATGKQKELAIKPLRKYVAANPRSVEGAELLARAYSLTTQYVPGNADSAAVAARRALDLNPKNADMWRIYANALLDKKDKSTKDQDTKAAFAAFEQLKKMGQFKDEDLPGYANVLYAMGRDKEAMDAIQKVLQTAPDSVKCDVYFNAGSLFMKKQDWTNATQMFEKKINCDPHNISAYLNAAACYMQIKNWSRTRQLLDTVIALAPNWQQGRIWLARYYLQVDSVDQAVGQYDRVLEEIGPNPDAKSKATAGEAHAMKASALFMNKRYGAAIEEFRRAASLGYDNSGVQLSWGQAILQTLDPEGSAESNKAKKEDAVKHFRQSLQLDKGNAQAHLWLAQGLVLLREPGNDQLNKQLVTEACSEYKAVLRLQPNNQDAKKGMERISCK